MTVSKEQGEGDKRGEWEPEDITTKNCMYQINETCIKDPESWFGWKRHLLHKSSDLGSNSRTLVNIEEESYFQKHCPLTSIHVPWCAPTHRVHSSTHIPLPSLLSLLSKEIKGKAKQNKRAGWITEKEHGGEDVKYTQGLVLRRSFVTSVQHLTTEGWEKAKKQHCAFIDIRA